MAEKTSAGLSGSALAVAVIVIGAWLFMLIWLTQQTGVTDVVWSRLLVVLSSMEAVAFGAAGALFGTHIQRQRVQDAKSRAENAEKRANDNEEDAAKGKILGKKVKEKLGGRPAPGGGGTAPGFRAGIERLSASGGMSEAASEVVALADALYPD